jgi:hypothetical protein
MEPDGRCGLGRQVTEMDDVVTRGDEAEISSVCG